MNTNKYNYIKKISVKKDYFSKIIHWANSNFKNVCALNSNTNPINSLIRKIDENGFDAIIAAGNDSGSNPMIENNFDQLNFFLKKNKTWIFGFFSYDLKNELEGLSSKNFDGIQMPLFHFFIPSRLFIFKNNSLIIHSTDANFDFERDIENSKEIVKDLSLNLKLFPRISKKEYIKKVKSLKEHIQRGDIYEINFCQEFYSENFEINPIEVYTKLNAFSPMPFSCFYKTGEKYLMCSSPERYLKKTGNKIVSQPIKGTIQRGRNLKEDKLQIKKLLENQKEQSENVMIVDLVRNDLSRIAKPGTVKVEELFAIYSYKHLHQMISTISCELDRKFQLLDVIKNTFPMGSMTGAPKVRAMELIEKYESTKRNLFSGAVGYINPEGDFDFNVVIRSILYNKKNRYVSAMAGSAITAGSQAEKEFEECLLKAEPMFRALGQV